MGALFSVAPLSSNVTSQFPEAQITNGIIKARLYLPDARKGYYRASRFDWAGVMPHLEYKGHTYTREWFENYDPMMHDAVMGPTDDFYPIGYDEAKAGDSFLKIGIGMVTKAKDEPYSIVAPYKLVNGGDWKYKKKKDCIAFNHKLSDKAYSYEYNKTIQLVKSKPEMVISHTLKNIGHHTMETKVYNHNFFSMDNQPIGKDYVVTFPYNLTGPTENTAGVGTFGRIEGNKIIFLKELQKKDRLFYSSLHGFGTDVKDYDIRIENHKTGAAVRITSDRPMSALVFWAADKVLSPEPYTNIKVEPGNSFTWKLFYQFYICDIKN
jgi:hypothetical protein